MLPPSHCTPSLNTPTQPGVCTPDAQSALVFCRVSAVLMRGLLDIMWASTIHVDCSSDAPAGYGQGGRHCSFKEAPVGCRASRVSVRGPFITHTACMAACVYMWVHLCTHARPHGPPPLLCAGGHACAHAPAHATALTPPRTHHCCALA
jgi:hypothetical protein